MIAYASRTGNVQYIVSQLQADNIEITENLMLCQPFLLITYTDQLGEVPIKVSQFLKNNYSWCQGVVASGNLNFGSQYFGGAGDKIANTYNIPLVRKVDLRGFKADYKAIQQFYETRVIHENVLEIK
ncbi:class Ib ribonucleoside-diphosphate reductase assembly flavoprotein NrdI [Lysinibacillus antri]|uniref:Class Ib ribonucleoside-diphosphate reductase assembly flavoprotein NrdI n=1 Tax=Lysinibacillus antri TaxID=2498145 RepID=A0A3S0P455_9BACI|nr:class Ib ribonucleoside-diphosphate reductase assembly flavoprotein NrdI [Lysinibacillus antri]RUL48715.1 class Ib ribonucleoside-diphosphate reductase assembly flavoprotein NrdI [Lysinibacillus antri]